MKNIQKIIDANGGIGALKKGCYGESYYIKLVPKSSSMMPLVIEFVGEFGNLKTPMISVAHYYQQNGDMMRDPEIVFLVPDDGRYIPMTYQQDSLGSYQEAIWLDQETGKPMSRPKLVNDLTSFSKQWDRNIKDQGYLELKNIIVVEESRELLGA